MGATLQEPPPSAAPAAPVVSLRSVEKYFGVLCALHGVSFEIGQGD